MTPTTDNQMSPPRRNDGPDPIETLAQEHRKPFAFALARRNELDQGLIEQVRGGGMQALGIGRLLA